MEFSASALHEQNSPAHLATVVEFMHWQGTRQPSPVDWTAAVDAFAIADVLPDSALGF